MTKGIVIFYCSDIMQCMYIRTAAELEGTALLEHFDTSYMILSSQIVFTQLAVESPFLQVECLLRTSRVQQKGLQ